MSGPCAPSTLRSTAVATNLPGLHSPKSLRVVELLAAGKSRLEAAREVGLDKANVRVIELRAKRRGLLGGPAAPVVTTDSPHGPSIRLALAADPDGTNGAIARRLTIRLGVNVSTAAVAKQRSRMAAAVKPVAPVATDSATRPAATAESSSVPADVRGVPSC